MLFGANSPSISATPTTLREQAILSVQQTLGNSNAANLVVGATRRFLELPETAIGLAESLNPITSARRSAELAMAFYNDPSGTIRGGVEALQNSYFVLQSDTSAGAQARGGLLFDILAPAGAARLAGLGRLEGVANTAAGFASEAKLLSHFEKHGAEFGVRSADDYLQVGQNIMQSGQKVEYLYKGETRTGYAQFMGNTSRGDAKFGFVGTNADGAITTIHTQSGNSFWKLLNGPSADKVIRPAP